MAYIFRLFPRGSSKELVCESLYSNRYSWFRPSEDFTESIIQLSQLLMDVTDIGPLKIFSHLPEIALGHEFSHSLSHKYFGEFLDHLLTSFSHWSNQTRNKKDLINIKLSGNYQSSITNALWLSRGNSDQIVSADFTGDGFTEGPFLRICQEIQFLGHLLSYAQEKGLKPLEFLGQTMKKKYAQNHDDLFGQLKLFNPVLVKSDPLYDSSILNLVELPKKNPHHHLINHINGHLKDLKKQASLIIFSNQNLFVPSQWERVSSFLKSVRVEAYFNFENLKGKGEIPSHLYILKKRSHKEQQDTLIKKGEKKESCLFFRWSGKLNSFYDFKEFIQELRHFQSQNDPSSRSLYHKELKKGSTFEFHQDAILSGKMLHSSSQDTSKVTHPVFFKNLTKNCITFDDFFYIESLNSNSKLEKSEKDFTLELLGLKVRHEDKFPFILIIDHSNPNKLDLEIIPSSSYKAKVEEYGRACFHYFGLKPKKLDINIDVFREYFLTNIGQQIIHISFDGTTKLKAKLQSFMTPKFFYPLKTGVLPLPEKFQFLKSGPQKIIKFSPQNLHQRFLSFEEALDKYLSYDPLDILNRVIEFRLSISQCLKENISTNNSSIYYNPIIRKNIENLKLGPLYDLHQDIHVRPLITEKKHAHLPLTEIQIKRKNDDHYLELISEDKVIFQLYSDPTLLNFISFLLGQAIDVPISNVLTSLQIPTVRDLKKVMEQYKEIEEDLTSIKKKCTIIISRIITTQINSPLSEK
jgi:hypothetical protein